MGPTRVPRVLIIQDPCPFGLPVISTAGQISLKKAEHPCNNLYIQAASSLKGIPSSRYSASADEHMSGLWFGCRCQRKRWQVVLDCADGTVSINLIMCFL